MGHKSLWGCIKIYNKLYSTLCYFYGVKRVTKEKIQNDIEHKEGTRDKVQQAIVFGTEASRGWSE